MTFTRGLALGMIVFVMACSARAGGGTGGTSGDPDASTATDASTNPAALCTELCARIAMTSGCSGDTAACERLCAAGRTIIPASCLKQYDATLQCARTSPITCSSGSQVSFTACTAQQMATSMCTRTATDDAGM